MSLKLAVRAFLAVLLLFFAADARAQADPAPDRSILTREQLAATGRPTVHAAVRALRPAWLRYRRSAQGFPAVYVDSALARDSAVLQGLRPHDVRWVQYSSPAEARVRFDTLHGAGVIHVSTRLPLSAAHPALPAAPAFQTRPGVSLAGAALRPMVERGNRFSSLEGGGAALAGSLPVGTGTLLLASVQYGKVTGPCACGVPEGAADEAASVLSGEAGVKFHAGGSGGWRPYVSALLGVHQVRWDPVLLNGTTFRQGSTEVGLGGSAGAGVDVRLGARLLLTAEGRMSMLGLADGTTGRLSSVRLGTTLLLGR